MVVGVGGKYCAGKNRVAELLAREGFRVIDVDRLGHSALLAREAEVVARFGKAIQGADGHVDRKALGRHVFRRRSELAALEALLHPLMVEGVRRQIAAGGNFVINAALLFTMGLHALCDLVLWVEAPLCSRIRRAAQRDGLPLFQLLRRVWAQRKLGPQPFLKNVDIRIVKNYGDPARLESAVLGFVKG